MELARPTAATGRPDRLINQSHIRPGPPVTRLNYAGVVLQDTFQESF